MTTSSSTWRSSTCWPRRAGRVRACSTRTRTRSTRPAIFSEPAFKTDWNYRLLLGVNYVCHLMMAERALVDEAGPLDPARDGAQDHDLLLRIAEMLPEHRIHHVPEILYHWRMSETSTAASISNKGYALEAGRSAIAGHLERRNLPAEVTNLQGMTLYKVVWQFAQTPKVRVIVPFKDEVEITRRCLDCLVANTAYPDMEIVLVDNWSITAEATAFTRLVEERGQARVLRVREPFNYARPEQPRGGRRRGGVPDVPQQRRLRRGPELAAHAGGRDAGRSALRHRRRQVPLPERDRAACRRRSRHRRRGRSRACRDPGVRGRLCRTRVVHAGDVGGDRRGHAGPGGGVPGRRRVRRAGAGGRVQRHRPVPEGAGRGLPGDLDAGVRGRAP